ncbi:MAG TPA: dephospho-CoA kinase [Clostridiales bacterium]|nr:dephospho-CoA kinase [Clostridiales bacterium]
MKVIGLTGGIGGGKSLVAHILRDKYKAYILDTDSIAKAQMEPGGASYQEVVAYIGDQVLDPDGRINRARLASIIFDDMEKRLKINGITHPKVLEEVQDKIQELRDEGTVPYLVVETALMIEAGYDYICDEVWYVYAPEEERRKRLKRDRNYSDEKIDSIFQNQMKEEAFRKTFSKVIENAGDARLVEAQVAALLEYESRGCRK